MKKIILLTAIITVALWSHSAQAAIWPVSLAQDSIVLELSQDLTIQITDYKYSGANLYVEYFQNGNALNIKVFPTSAQAAFVLITANNDLAVANPQYNFAPALTDKVVTAEEHHTEISRKGKYELFRDKNIVINAESQTKLETLENLRDYTHGDLQQISHAYDIKNNETVPLKLNLLYNKATDNKKVVQYFDYQDFQWKDVPVYNDVDESRVYFELTAKRFRVAVFEKAGSQDGKASWYDQSLYKTFSYKNGNFAAHRTLPKGTKLRVTRLLTGKSIDVTVNDWGPEEKTGRIIDLDKQAFEALSSLGAGVVYVNVQIIND